MSSSTSGGPGAGASDGASAEVSTSSKTDHAVHGAPADSNAHGAASHHKHGHGGDHDHHAKPGGSWGCSITEPPVLLVDWLSSDDRTAAERAQEMGHRHISWSELFFDLIFVSAIARLGEDLRGDDDDADPLPMVDYLLLFFTLYQLWLHVQYYTTRFFVDSLLNKVWLALLMVGVMVLAVHAKDGIHSDSITTYAWVRAGCSVMLILPYVQVAALVPKYSAYGVQCVVIQSVDTALYIGAALAPVGTLQREMCLVGAVLTFPMFLLYLILAKATPLPSLPYSMPPLDLEHFTERIGLFLIIVLGESVNGISLNVASFRLALYCACVWGFQLVFFVKVLYFDVDPKTLSQHAMRRSVYAGITWVLCHYVLFCATAVTGSGVAMAVQLAGADTPDPQSGVFVDPERARWYLGAGMGASLASLSVIRLCHSPPGGDLPAKYGSRTVCLARVADVVQIVMAVVCSGAPWFAPPSVASTETLAAGFAMCAAVNVVLNVLVGQSERAAEAACNADEEAAEEAELAKARRESAAVVQPPPSQGYGSTLAPDAPVQPTHISKKEAARLALAAIRAVAGSGDELDSIRQDGARRRARTRAARRRSTAGLPSGKHFDEDDRPLLAGVHVSAMAQDSSDSSSDDGSGADESKREADGTAGRDVAQPLLAVSSADRRRSSAAIRRGSRRASTTLI